ncbi:hypothetical protein WA158_006434 [Blastocystis sp. Blastoise]
MSDIPALKKDLIKSVNQEDFDRIEQILRELEKIEITFDTLKETGIGKTLSSIKKQKSTILQKKEGLTDKFILINLLLIFIKLLEKWKKTVASDLHGHLSPSASDCVSTPKADTPKADTPKAETPKAETPKENENGTVTYNPEEATALIKQKLLLPSLHETSLTVRELLIKSFMDEIKKGDYDIQSIVLSISELEEALLTHYNCTNIPMTDECLSQFRNIKFNLRQNEKLRHRYMNGQLTAKELVTMTSDDMKTDEQKEEEARSASIMFESKRMDWAKAHRKEILEQAGLSGVDGTFKCPRCKSKNTSYFEKQTRSADEPMTVFVCCEDCGKRWRF